MEKEIDQLKACYSISDPKLMALEDQVGDLTNDVYLLQTMGPMSTSLSILVDHCTQSLDLQTCKVEILHKRILSLNDAKNNKRKAHLPTKTRINNLVDAGSLLLSEMTDLLDPLNEVFEDTEGFKDVSLKIRNDMTEIRKEIGACMHSLTGFAENMNTVRQALLSEGCFEQPKKKKQKK